MDTAQVKYNVQDDSIQVAAQTRGIICMEGKTLRGPVNDPSTIITSPLQFKKLFGDYVPGGPDFPLLCLQALSQGSQIRANRILHYSDPSDKTTISAIKAVCTKIGNVSRTYTLTFDAAIQSDNKVKLTINGHKTYKLYHTSSNQTLADCASDIQANIVGVASATVPNIANGTNNARAIVIVCNAGVTLNITESVVINVPATGETLATGTVKMTVAGNAGDHFELFDFNGNILGSVVQTGGLSLATLAQNLRTNILVLHTDWVVVVDGGDPTQLDLTAPVGSGASANGNLAKNATGAINGTITGMSGGINGTSQSNVHPGIVVTASAATINDVVNSTNEALFNLAVKYYGVDYNNLTLTVENATNGQAAYFNLRLVHATDSLLNELYENLTIPGAPNISQSKYLDVISKNPESCLKVTYYNLSVLVGTMRPVNGTYTYQGGSDGDSVVAGDYAGDPVGGTGFHAYDAIEDSMIMAAPELSDATVHAAGEVYCLTYRNGDMVYFQHLDNSNTTATSLISARNTLGNDDSNVITFGGGIEVVEPITGNLKNMSELGYVLGLYGYSHAKYGPWKSVANSTRAKIVGIIDVVNNFGSRAQLPNLNLLANQQINMVINRNGVKMIWGNYTSQRKTSYLSKASIKFLELTIQRDLKPTLENYLEEPMSIPTFRKLYHEVRPYFEDLLSNDKQALSKYTWAGDQDSKDMDHLDINNNVNDLVAGKYKIKLSITPINSLQEIDLTIFLTPAGVQFQTN